MSTFDQRGQIIVGSQLNQNFGGSGKEVDESLKTFIQKLEQLLPEMPLQDETKLELAAEAQTVKIQIASPKPKVGILRESLQTIRAILEGIAGNAIYAGLVSSLNQFLSN